MQHFMGELFELFQLLANFFRRMFDRFSWNAADLITIPDQQNKRFCSVYNPYGKCEKDFT